MASVELRHPNPACLCTVASIPKSCVAALRNIQMRPHGGTQNSNTGCTCTAVHGGVSSGTTVHRWTEAIAVNRVHSTQCITQAAGAGHMVPVCAELSSAATMEPRTWHACFARRQESFFVEACKPVAYSCTATHQRRAWPASFLDGGGGLRWVGPVVMHAS